MLGLLDEDIEVFWEAEEGGEVDDMPRGHQQGRMDMEEEEEEEEEEVTPMPIRVVRNLLNQLWEGAPAQEDSSDDDGAGSA
ncbi:hypothetical protein OG21DRAFT_1491208 [Imleria badia]|nr:hypothetical protein OG21DRAFT_1491208 [Imleria badia]